MSKSRTPSGWRGSRRRSQIGPAGLAICSTACWLAACRDPALTTERLETVEVKTVSAYGLALGPEASPKDVAYVLLRAIRDDVVAARQKDRQLADNAWATQRAVSAPDRILAEISAQLSGQESWIKLTPTEAVYKLARFWAPVAGHYVDALDLTREQAEEKMRVLEGPAEAKQVIMDLKNATDGSATTLRISLVREKGYWRAYRVGFSQISVAQLAAQKTTQPGG